MSIKDTLRDIADLARYYKIDKPYIVGGLPRDIYLQKEIKTSDVDLTTNSADVLRLGILVSDKLNVPFELSEDGHVTVFADEFDIDFSSHFISENVVRYLDGKHKGFEEAFSRDFTINSLHQDLETGEFFDPTGMAVTDIKNRVIRTPVPPEITLGDDPRRVYRAINLAVRYDCSIDEELVSFIENNLDMFSPENIKDKYITLKINKALNIDPDKTIDLLKQVGLFQYVPLSGDFKNILIEKKELINYLEPKTASKVPKTWEEYSAQGPEYEKLKDWWKSNYYYFENYKSPSYNSWTKWYMDRFRGNWKGKHKGPEEALKLMEEEASAGSGTLEEVVDTAKKFVQKVPVLNYFFPQDTAAIPTEVSADAGGFFDNINKGSAVDINNVSKDVKSFLRVLGNTAKEMGAETPFVTSGYRTPEKQASLMFYNWQENGGLQGGREYLEWLYGREYGKKVADVFEQYQGSSEAIQAIMPLVQQYGSRHTRNPAQAIDLRITNGITDVLKAIQSTGRFDMKLVDERNTNGPHWHVTIYQDKGSSQRIARIIDRKKVLIKIAANN